MIMIALAHLQLESGHQSKPIITTQLSAGPHSVYYSVLDHINPEFSIWLLITCLFNSPTTVTIDLLALTTALLWM
jgi:hypothetical protein